jgi:hypothetical protein
MFWCFVFPCFLGMFLAICYFGWKPHHALFPQLLTSTLYFGVLVLQEKWLGHDSKNVSSRKPLRRPKTLSQTPNKPTNLYE